MTSVGANAADSHDAASTALRGASLAFQNKKPAPPPPKKDNGALTAATSAEQSASRNPARPLGSQSTGSTVGGAGLLAPPDAQHQHRHHTGGSVERNMSTRSVGPGSSPSPGVKVDTKSPSFIAATLAASRSASPTPKPQAPSRTQSATATAPAEAVDSMSIAPTGSLISMFEQGGTEAKPPKRSPGGSPTRAADTALDEVRRPKLEPKPSLQPPSTPAAGKVAPPPVSKEKPREKPKEKPGPSSEPSGTAPQAKPKPKPKPRPVTPPAIISRSEPELVSPKPRRAVKPSLASVTPRPAHPTNPPKLAPAPALVPAAPKNTNPPQFQTSSVPPKRAPRDLDGGASSSDLETSKLVQQAPRPPTPPKPRRSQATTSAQHKDSNRRRAGSGSYFPPPPPSSQDIRRELAQTGHYRAPSASSNSSNDTFVSASSTQSPSRPDPPTLPARRMTTASAPSSPVRSTPLSLTPRPMRHANASSSTLPLESLTTAIVAGSLASASLTPHHSGSLPAPPLPARHKSPRLLQTLRQPHSASDDEAASSADRHRKGGHHLRKLRGGNKHSHNEGARKRWREEMTQRERKRYEALWASNRGLLLGASSRQAQQSSGSGEMPVLDTSQYVVNVAVREVWKRSRLPDDELAEVWDLVDRHRRGMLDRQEFVVGTWLIDQRLRGRKIPHRVGESVWGSANGVHVHRPKVKR